MNGDCFILSKEDKVNIIALYEALIEFGVELSESQQDTYRTVKQMLFS